MAVADSLPGREDEGAIRGKLVYETLLVQGAGLGVFSCGREVDRGREKEETEGGEGEIKRERARANVSERETKRGGDLRVAGGWGARARERDFRLNWVTGVSRQGFRV